MSLALIALLVLGGVGLYLALPGGRLHARRAALIVLIGAAAAMVGFLAQNLAGGQTPAWFVVFALIGLFGGVRMITHSRPVYSALYFILVVISVAGMLILAQAEFLAVALLIIYAGAILVTYVFVIMLAQQGATAPYDRQAREPLLGCLAGFVLLAAITGRMFSAGPAVDAASEAAAADGAEILTGTVQAVGTSLLTQYVVGVELAGVLLLAAMVGAIAIARRKLTASAVEEGSPC